MRPTEHERAKPTGRKPLPENLPRVEIEVLRPEGERQGKDAFERIGEDTSEVLERRRASLVVVRTIRGKYVRKDRERCAETEVFVAPPLDATKDE
jgi:transposase